MPFCCRRSRRALSSLRAGVRWPAALLYIKTDSGIPAAKGASVSRIYLKVDHRSPSARQRPASARRRAGGREREREGGRERGREPRSAAARPGYSWQRFPAHKLQGGERGERAARDVTGSPRAPAGSERGASGSARPRGDGRRPRACACVCARGGGRRRGERERCAGRAWGGQGAGPGPLPAGGERRSPSPSPWRELPGEPVPACHARGLRVLRPENFLGGRGSLLPPHSSLPARRPPGSRLFGITLSVGKRNAAPGLTLPRRPTLTRPRRVGARRCRGPRAAGPS